MNALILLCVLAGGGPYYPVPFPAVAAPEVRGAERLEVWWGVLKCGDLRISRRKLQRLEGRGLPVNADLSPAAADLSPAPGRQNLLTELLGISCGGLAAADPEPLSLTDPWLVVAVDGSLSAGSDCTVPVPWPWSIEDGLSSSRAHFLQDQAQGTLMPIYADWKREAGSGMEASHHYIYAGRDGGEPLFTRDGRGSAKTAQEWLNIRLPGNDPGLHFFDTVDGRPPVPADARIRRAPNLTPAVTISSREAFLMQGFVFFNAKKVRIRGLEGKGVDSPINMPGEPFADCGIDLDGDGAVCDSRRCCPESPVSPLEKTLCSEWETIGNGRWDVELDEGCDAESRVCDSDARTLYIHDGWPLFTKEHTFPKGVLPHGGSDPRTLSRFPHEAFLNLDYPVREASGFSVRIDYAAAERATRRSRPISPGRDIVGALTRVPLHLWGVLYNEGPIVLGGGFTAFGAVLSGEALVMRGRARIFSDAALSRPPPEWEIPPPHRWQRDRSR